jgi:hypothetical protein
MQSEPWVKWMATNICYESELVGRRPEWLGNRRVLGVDLPAGRLVQRPARRQAGREELRQGKNGMEFALYPPAGGQVMDIFTLETVEIKLTDLSADRQARKQGKNYRTSKKSAGMT